MSQVVIHDEYLTDIANAIRLKSNTEDTYTLEEMAPAIQSITTGHAPYKVTGNCTRKFENANKLFSTFKDYIQYIADDQITYCNYMFSGCADMEEVPFDIVNNTQKPMEVSHMFSYCSELKEIPYMNCKNGPWNMSYMFDNCPKLKEIPIEKIPMVNNKCKYKDCRYFFNNCKSLRSFPIQLINPSGEQLTDNTNSGISLNLGNAFYNCYVLDELVGLHFPCPSTLATYEKYNTNQFSQTFVYCNRLSRLVFAGNGVERKMSGQTIDLSFRVGYSGGMSLTELGMKDDKMVSDDTTYQALKDDPDWWTVSYTYSRYNKTSAIETINSLPDTAAHLATYGGTNTIKFYGNAGSGTDGGAINTMTEAEIAVATAKGWTVTFV